MSKKNSRSIEEKKKKILFISVAVIGFVIFLSWLYGFSYNLKFNHKKNKPSENKSTQITEIKNQINNIKQELKENTEQKNNKQRADIILNEKEEKMMQEMKVRLEQELLLNTSTTPPLLPNQQ
ncbi:hypothetical protein HOD96_03145 [Candidatus Falkowbacteria bacterium]|jgi:flagellar basal body-associated protein FliL|nr:hypothetical protein [Candidatus Falkowbacteria bacterium]MBT4432747.1 hypothetical protein [Candidatus Falkowbacteria bacterium]